MTGSFAPLRMTQKGMCSGWRRCTYRNLGVVAVGEGETVKTAVKLDCFFSRQSLTRLCFCIFMHMVSEIFLKKDIQASLDELTADRDVFEKAEFNTAGIQKMFEKYGEQVPVSIFSEAAKIVLEKLEKYPEIKLNQIRIGFPIANTTVRMMLVVKRISDALVTEQEMDNLTMFENEMLDVEDSFVHKYSYTFPEMSPINNSIKIEFHWLLSDERLNASALQYDYPILVRI